VFTATLGGPLVKTAALSYGISKAVRARRSAKQAKLAGGNRSRRRGSGKR
jgi:hypothetical protein